MAETIKIGGEIESTATGNKVADVANIKDKTKGNKSQAQINAELETALEERYTKSETYNKTQLDNMITTPEIAYKDYDTYAAMLAETNHPAGAIYRVANYDGTQAVTNKYAEYSWDGTQYKLMAVRDHGIDEEPTAGSENLVKSGGVQNELALGAVYDVSAKNPTAGPNNDGKWESLSALLSDANLNTLIPTFVRKGGMSIRFVQTSDNKYIQARLMANEFSTNPSDWQVVDDEPTADSNNLVKSGGVYNQIQPLNELLERGTDDKTVFYIKGGHNRRIFEIEKEQGKYRTVLEPTFVKKEVQIRKKFTKGPFTGNNNNKVFFSESFVVKANEVATITYSGTYSFMEYVDYKANKTPFVSGVSISTPGTYRIQGGFSNEVTEVQLAQVEQDFLISISQYVTVDNEPVSSKALLPYIQPIVKNNLQTFKKDYIDINDTLAPIWGWEYLEHWYERIYDGTNNVIVAMSGDSITQGYTPPSGYTDCFMGMRNYFIKKIMKAGGYDLSKLTVYNCGVGGRSTNEYVGNPTYGNASWIAAYPNGFVNEDMALNPDLYILAWGVNDVLAENESLTLEERLSIFAANMEEALIRIRGNNTYNGRPAYNKKVSDMSIIICLPVVGGRPNTGRGYDYWNQYIRDIIRPLCRKYFCAYADFTYNTYQHTEMPTIWGAQGNNPQIHPNKYSQAQTMSMLQELVYPIGLWQVGEITQGTNDNPRYHI